MSNELHDFAAKKRAEWTHGCTARHAIEAELRDSAKANNARYEHLRRSGLGPDEALDAMAAEQGVNRSQINCPLWVEDEGDIDDAIAML